MNLVYIENKEFLAKIVTYLDFENINYTFDVFSHFDCLIISQFNKKTLELIEKSKRVIYIAYLDEIKLYNNYLKKNKKASLYISKMKENFSKCNVVITSLPFFKKVLNCKKIMVIPYENLCVGLCKNKIFNIRKKVITIIDSNYKYLDYYFDLIHNSNLNYELIGFNSDLSKRDKSLLNDLPKNLNLIKYCNERILQNYINNSQLIIYFDNIIESSNYLNICLNLKKNILLLDSELCNDYLIDNKNIYLFSLNNFEKKFNRIIKNRVCNLGVEGYNLVKENTFKKIADKFCKLLK